MNALFEVRGPLAPPDGPTTLEFYFAACAAQGLPRPNPLVE